MSNDWNVSRLQLTELKELPPLSPPMSFHDENFFFPVPCELTVSTDAAGREKNLQQDPLV